MAAFLTIIAKVLLVLACMLTTTFATVCAQDIKTPDRDDAITVVAILAFALFFGMVGAFI